MAEEDEEPTRPARSGGSGGIGREAGGAVNWVKKHWPVVLGGAGLVFVYLWWRNGQSGTQPLAAGTAGTSTTSPDLNNLLAGLIQQDSSLSGSVDRLSSAITSAVASSGRTTSGGGQPVTSGAAKTMTWPGFTTAENNIENTLNALVGQLSKQVGRNATASQVSAAEKATIAKFGGLSSGEAQFYLQTLNIGDVSAGLHYPTLQQIMQQADKIAGGAAAFSRLSSIQQNQEKEIANVQLLLAMNPHKAG